MRVVGDTKCAVCDSTHDLGKCPEKMYIVCKQHANMQPHAVNIVAECRETNTRISKTFFDAGRWNSYDRDAMLPHFSDELLVEHTAYTLNNCSRINSPASTYDEAIQLYAKELALRLVSNAIRLRRMDKASVSLVERLKEYSSLDKVLTVEVNAVIDSFKDRDRRGITEIIIQPIAPGQSCVGDVVLDDLSIERYEIRRVL